MYGDAPRAARAALMAAILRFPRISRIFLIFTRILVGFYKETGVLGGPRRGPTKS